MTLKPLVSLAALGLLVSLFLPWSDVPILGTISIYDVARPVFDQYRALVDQTPVQDLARQLLSEAPWQILVFAGSFAAALLCLVTSLLHLGPRLWAFLSGGCAAISVLIFVLQGSAALDEVGLPLDLVDPSLADLWNLLPLGPKVYLGCAAVLLLLAIFAPSRGRYRA